MVGHAFEEEVVGELGRFERLRDIESGRHKASGERQEKAAPSDRRRGVAPVGMQGGCCGRGRQSYVASLERVAHRPPGREQTIRSS